MATYTSGWPWPTGTTTSTTGNYDTIWLTWTGSNTTSTTTSYYLNTTQQIVWQAWETMPQPNGRCPLSGHPRPEGVDRAWVRDWHEQDWVPQEVYDERQTARQEEANARRDQEQREHAAAEARADELLLSLLDEPARERYLAEGVVEVRVESGRLYELKKGWAGNVAELDPHTRKRTRRFCIHPRTSMPVADNLVAQMLLLQADEDEFHRIANASVLA